MITRIKRTLSSTHKISFILSVYSFYALPKIPYSIIPYLTSFHYTSHPYTCREHASLGYTALRSP